MAGNVDKQLKFQLLRSQEFNIWFEKQTEATQGLILARLHRISVEGHFGTTNYFDDLIELKWVSGLRVYTARIGRMIIIILGGGNKNGQNKDIKNAKKTLEKIKRSFIDNP
jgi:putative addiction module killer protein